MRNPWQRLGWIAVGLATLEVASRTVLPGIHPEALAAAVRGGGLIRLYEIIGGGGLSRGAVLGLGLMPYLAARLWVSISRLGNAGARTFEGRRRMRRDTRALTILLAVIQSLGFVNFIEGIPGVVTRPGLPFVFQTMAVLTLSAVAAMMVVELASPASTEEEEAEQLLLPPTPPSPIEVLATPPIAKRSE